MLQRMAQRASWLGWGPLGASCERSIWSRAVSGSLQYLLHHGMLVFHGA